MTVESNPTEPPRSVAEVTKTRYSQELDRGIHLVRAMVLSVASVGPAGTIFAFVPIVFFICGTFAFWALLIALVFSFCEGFAYAELGSAYPVAGGEYAMVGRTLGKWVGAFLFAVMLTEYIFVPSGFALGAGIYLGALWPWAGAHLHVVGVACLVWAIVVSLLRVKLGSWVAGFFLVIQMIAVGALIVLGLLNAHNPVDRWFTPTAYAPDGTPFGQTATTVLLGITISFFCYQGFGNAIIFSEETRGAKKHMARIVIWSVTVTGAAILVPSICVLLGAPSLKDLFTAQAPMTYFIESTAGHTLNNILSFVIFLALLDAITASMMAFTRVVYSGGRDNAWPTPVSKALAYVHPRFKTPWVSIIVLGLIAVVLTALSNIAAVVTFLGVITITYVGLLGLSAVVIRLKKNPPERYKMPLWPVPSAILIVACGAMFTQQTLKDVWIIMGIGLAFVVYYLIYLRPRPNHWVFLEPVEDESPEGKA
jgi:amino acid transporter